MTAFCTISIAHCPTQADFISADRIVTTKDHGVRVLFGLIQSIRDAVADGWEDEYYHDPAADDEEGEAGEAPTEEYDEDGDDDEAYDSMYEEAWQESADADQKPGEDTWDDGAWDGEPWKEEEHGKAWEEDAQKEEAPSTPKASKTPKSSRKSGSSSKKRSGRSKLKRHRSMASLVSSAPSTPPKVLPRSNTQESYMDPGTEVKEAELRGLLKQIEALSTAAENPMQPVCIVSADM